MRVGNPWPHQPGISTTNFSADGGKVAAYVWLTLSCGVAVRDCKIVTPGDGRRFLALPSRERHAHCGGCGTRVNLRDRYCRACGTAQPARGPAERPYHDIVYPVGGAVRAELDSAVFAEWDAVVRGDRPADLHAALRRAKAAGARP